MEVKQTSYSDKNFSEDSLSRNMETKTKFYQEEEEGCIEEVASMISTSRLLSDASCSVENSGGDQVCSKWKKHISKLRGDHLAFCAICSANMSKNYGKWRLNDVSVRVRRMYVRKCVRDSAFDSSDDEKTPHERMRLCERWRKTIQTFRCVHQKSSECEKKIRCLGRSNKTRQWRLISIDLPEKNLPKDRYRFYINRWQKLLQLYGNGKLDESDHLE